MSEETDTNVDESVDETENERQERIHEIREKDQLSKLFRKSNAQIIAALLTSPYDLNATSISEASGVNRTTVYEQKDDLLELGVIEQTRTEGQSPMYDIADTEIAEAVANLYAILYSD
jgi:hypothetical protein